MTISEFKEYINNLTNHVTFDYNGHGCRVDPLSLNSFDMLCDENETNVKSIDDVLNVKFFKNKSLTKIWVDISEIDC